MPSHSCAHPSIASNRATKRPNGRATDEWRWWADCKSRMRLALNGHSLSRRTSQRPYHGCFCELEINRRIKLSKLTKSVQSNMFVEDPFVVLRVPYKARDGALTTDVLVVDKLELVIGAPLDREPPRSMDAVTDTGLNGRKKSCSLAGWRSLTRQDTDGLWFICCSVCGQKVHGWAETAVQFPPQERTFTPPTAWWVPTDEKKPFARSCNGQAQVLSTSTPVFDQC